MTPEEFVKGFKEEKEDLLKYYFDSNQNSEINQFIKDQNLDSKRISLLKSIIDSVLTDSFYTTLLGLDGSASIGKNQEMYKLLDEEDNELTGGEIEAFAWELFHGDKK